MDCLIAYLWVVGFYYESPCDPEDHLPAFAKPKHECSQAGDHPWTIVLTSCLGKLTKLEHVFGGTCWGFPQWLLDKIEFVTPKKIKEKSETQGVKKNSVHRK